MLDPRNGQTLWDFAVQVQGLLAPLFERVRILFGPFGPVAMAVLGAVVAFILLIKILKLLFKVATFVVLPAILLAGLVTQFTSLSFNFTLPILVCLFSVILLFKA